MSPRRKSPLVHAVGRLVESVGAGGQIDGRADRGDGDKRRPRAPFAGELEHQIAAHGVADQSHALEAEALGEVLHHGAHIGGAAGVIERGRERIGAAAVAHVHADDVHAGGPGARGDAPHVAGIGRALEAVHQNRREPRGAHRLRLPMAMAEDAARVGGIDFDGFGDGGQAKGGTGKKLPTMVCRWPLVSQGWGSKEVSHAGSSAGVCNAGLAGITEIARQG